jgi:HPt (histidine-containing phosphotransfer) domain-containing protein
MPPDTPSNTDASAQELQPLYSEYRSDPEMVELIEFFLQELSQQAVNIDQAFEMGDVQRLRVLSHQLKGAAGGYGYPSISASAGAVESAVLADEANLSNVAEHVEALTLLCRQAAAGAASNRSA